MKFWGLVALTLIYPILFLLLVLDGRGYLNFYPDAGPLVAVMGIGVIPALVVSCLPISFRTKAASALVTSFLLSAIHVIDQRIGQYAQDVGTLLLNSLVYVTPYFVVFVAGWLMYSVVDFLRKHFREN